MGNLQRKLGFYLDRQHSILNNLKNFTFSLTKRTSMCYDIYTLRNAYISSTLTRYLQWNSTDVESLVPVSERFVRN